MDTESVALAGLRRRGQFLISSLLWACVLGLLVTMSTWCAVVYTYAIASAERVGVNPVWVATAAPLLLVAVLLGAYTWYRRIWNRRLRQRRPGVTLEELEKDIAERALTTGLVVGISHNRWIDLFTIFTATLELQLHVLTTLGKRPSWRTWRLLIQRCGASLFINSYLSRQDSLMLNLMIKKAGMGLSAAGDVVRDIDLDDALGIQHGGVLGVATKSLELGATMALSVGQVGLHTLGSLIESVGDELVQGAIAGGIIYFHGMALATDALGVENDRNVRDAIWKMGEVAGVILLEFIRQRRTAFRERRQQVIKSLPKAAYDKIQVLFGRRGNVAAEVAIVPPEP